VGQGGMVWRGGRVWEGGNRACWGTGPKLGVERGGLNKTYYGAIIGRKNRWDREGFVGRTGLGEGAL